MWESPYKIRPELLSENTDFDSTRKRYVARLGRASGRHDCRDVAVWL